ncbi:MAG: hypothetical protein U0X76_12945 [Bacteroidia bacterium]
MNVTMEVSLVDLIRSLANNSNDGTFNRALENAQKAQAKKPELVRLFVKEFEKLQERPFVGHLRY